MHAKLRTIAWLLVVMLVLPGLASAGRKGRLIGMVVDPDGNPVEGVTVTATSAEVPGFREVEVTDAKGVFKIDFDVINVLYMYVFDKVGYHTLKTEQTWQKDGTARYEFVLHPGETAVVDDLSAGTTTSEAVTAFNRGVAAFDANDYETAAASFEAAVGHDPDLRQAWAALCVVQLELKRYADAVAAAEKAMELGATDELVLRARWEAYRNLGDEAKTAEAQADLERFGRMAEEAKRIFNEGVALARADDHEGAFAKFKEASELDPNLEEALLGVATTGLQVGRNDEALAAAQTMLARDPHDEQALRIRYNACLALGDEEQLVDALVGLAEVDPGTAREGLWLLALASYDANDMVRAKARLEKLLGVDPNRPQAHYYLGLIYLNEDAKARAKRHLERFVELAPDHPEAATARELIGYVSGP